MAGVLESVYAGRHLTSLMNVDGNAIRGLISLAHDIENRPAFYEDSLRGKKALVYFSKPSFRTDATFDAGMQELGLHAKPMYEGNTPSKEPIKDRAMIAAGLYDVIVARLGPQEQIEEWAAYARRGLNGHQTAIPVINGLTNEHHPCQILSDVFTMYKVFGSLEGLKVAFVGDGPINTTHDLMLACSALGIDISVATPPGAENVPLDHIVAAADRNSKLTGSRIELTTDPINAVQGARVVYTDTWRSYHVPEEDMPRRMNIFSPYKVDGHLMSQAHPDAVFMHCLPAYRGEEVTAEVIDGPQSIVIDQAINRKYMQKAILLALMKGSQSR